MAYQNKWVSHTCCLFSPTVMAGMPLAQRCEQCTFPLSRRSECQLEAKRDIMILRDQPVEFAEADLCKTCCDQRVCNPDLPNAHCTYEHIYVPIHHA